MFGTRSLVISAALAAALWSCPAFGGATTTFLFDNHFDDNDADITTNLNGIGGGFTPATSFASIDDPADGTTATLATGWYGAQATITSINPVNAVGTTFQWQMTNCTWGAWMSFDLINPDDSSKRLTFQLGSQNVERVAINGPSGQAHYVAPPTGLPHGWSAGGANTVTLTTDETGFALNWTTNPGEPITKKWNEVVSGPSAYNLSTITNSAGEALIYAWMNNIGGSLTIDRISAWQEGSALVSHPGDANRDGVVDLQDFGALKDNFGAVAGATWEQGDFNTDSVIDLQDFGILKDHFGHTDGDSPVRAVPEPGSLVILAGLAGFVRRKLRR